MMTTYVGFYGLFGSPKTLNLSEGMSTFAEMLRFNNIGGNLKNGVYPHNSLKTVLEVTQKTISKNTEIVVFGHSLGAISAFKYAREMSRKGYKIKCVLLFDYVTSVSLWWDKRTAYQVAAPVYHFRSSDLRAIKLPGSLEYNYSKLNHLQIDSNKDVLQTALKIALK